MISCFGLDADNLVSLSYTGLTHFKLLINLQISYLTCEINVPLTFAVKDEGPTFDSSCHLDSSTATAYGSRRRIFYAHIIDHGHDDGLSPGIFSLY